MRKCSKCHQELPDDAFYGKGWQWYCKNCSNEYTREYFRHRYATDPEFRKKVNKEAAERQRRRVILDPEYWKRVRQRSETSRVCRILFNHSEDLKGDPEHLSTEYIVRLCKIKIEEE